MEIYHKVVIKIIIFNNKVVDTTYVPIGPDPVYQAKLTLT